MMWNEKRQISAVDERRETLLEKRLALERKRAPSWTTHGRQSTEYLFWYLWWWEVVQVFEDLRRKVISSE